MESRASCCRRRRCRPARGSGSLRNAPPPASGAGHSRRAGSGAPRRCRPVRTDSRNGRPSLPPRLGPEHRLKSGVPVWGPLQHSRFRPETRPESTVEPGPASASLWLGGDGVTGVLLPEAKAGPHGGRAHSATRRPPCIRRRPFPESGSGRPRGAAGCSAPTRRTDSRNGQALAAAAPRSRRSPESGAPIRVPVAAIPDGPRRQRRRSEDGDGSPFSVSTRPAATPRRDLATIRRPRRPRPPSRPRTTRTLPTGG